MLIHLHIAKTGGTSLNSMVKHAFRPEEVFETAMGTPGAMQQVPLRLYPAFHGGIKYVSGHVPLGIHRLLGRQCKYVTTVRNPVDRIISFFFFQLDDQGRYMNGNTPLTFEEYVESGMDIQLHNYQTRVLCGLKEVETMGREQHPPRTLLDRTHLQQAKDNIEKHFFAAPIERLTELGLTLRRYYKWPMRRVQAERMNVSSKHHISRELSDALHDLNWLDRELHDWVTHRFVNPPAKDRFFYFTTNLALRSVSKMIPPILRKRIAQTFLWS